MSDWFNHVKAATSSTDGPSGNGNIPTGAGGPGVSSIDGVALSTGDRMLLKNQTTASQNGTYTYQGSTTTQLGSGGDTNAPRATVRVDQGTINAKTQWSLVDTTNYVWAPQNLVFNVSDFPGTTTAAIQAADAAAALVGGTVYFPPGTYAITSAIGPSAGVTWMCAARGAATIQQTTAATDCILSTDSPNSRIADIAIQGNGAHGVHIKGVSNMSLKRPCTLERVNISGFGSAGKLCTATSSSAVITCNNHGFASGTRIQFQAPCAGGYANPKFAASGNTITFWSGTTQKAHGLATADAIQFNEIFDAGLLPTGIASRTTYYAIIVDSNTIKIATSAANATAGTAIVFTGDGAVHTDNILWGVVPAPLDPRLEYWVSSTNLLTNSFEVSSVPPSAPSFPVNITMSAPGASTCRVAAVAGGIFYESAGVNLYDAYCIDAYIEGGTYGDGSAKHGIITDSTGTYFPVHTTLINGQIENLKRAFSNRAGELRAISTHVNAVIDGSGGGLLAYSNSSQGLDVRHLRLEVGAIEGALYQDTGGYNAHIDGSLGFKPHCFTDQVGNADYQLCNDSTTPNRHAGAHTFLLLQDTIQRANDGSWRPVWSERRCRRYVDAAQRAASQRRHQRPRDLQHRRDAHAGHQRRPSVLVRHAGVR